MEARRSDARPGMALDADFMDRRFAATKRNVTANIATATAILASRLFQNTPRYPRSWYHRYSVATLAIVFQPIITTIRVTMRTLAHTGILPIYLTLSDGVTQGKKKGPHTKRP
jgi:uncharacterized membrane protein YdbT with pleckstrin-like domain